MPGLAYMVGPGLYSREASERWSGSEWPLRFRGGLLPFCSCAWAGVGEWAMGTKRVDGEGRFVADGPREAAAGKVPGTAGFRVGRAPRPAYCRTYARARVAEALPVLMPALLEQALRGSVPHLKAVMQLAGLDKGDVVPRKTKRRGKSVGAVLLEQWARHKAETAAAAAEHGHGQDPTSQTRDVEHPEPGSVYNDREDE